MDKLGELRESIEMLEDILNYAYEGYVLVDPQGRIVKMNYDNLLGIKEEDAIGKHVEDVIENTR
ncbi:MAG: PAS domain S-box protein, partial [Tissierellaceae bacterium]